MNFIHHNWPSLIQANFIEEFITPIVKATKGKNEELPFFSIPEYLNWKRNTPNWHTYRVKYYKGTLLPFPSLPSLQGRLVWLEVWVPRRPTRRGSTSATCGDTASPSSTRVRGG